MKNLIIGSFLALTATTAIAQDSQQRYISKYDIIREYMILKDTETGCEWFKTDWGLIPRMSVDGKTQYGCGEE